MGASYIVLLFHALLANSVLPRRPQTSAFWSKLNAVETATGDKWPTIAKLHPQGDLYYIPTCKGHVSQSFRMTYGQ